jgi:hypothetical protein
MTQKRTLLPMESPANEFAVAKSNDLFDDPGELVGKVGRRDWLLPTGFEPITITKGDGTNVEFLRR